MSEIKDNFNKLSNIANKTFNNVIQSENNYVIICFVIIFFILFSLISWIFNTLSLRTQGCKRLLNQYKYKEDLLVTTSYFNINQEPRDSFSSIDNSSNSILRNYHIKTAYNCCCMDGYKNNFVDLCALDTCIKFGARCLDFEIYSYNGEPIIAASSVNNNYIKETYNYLSFDKVMEHLNIACFDEEFTSCHNDPMFLHFRIKSTNVPIYDKMAKIIKDKLFNNSNDHYIKYYINTPNYNINDFLVTHIDKFYQKFIIMVHSANFTEIETSKLANFINIKSGGEKCHLIHEGQLDAAGKFQPFLMDQTKSNLVILLPNSNSRIDNYDSLIAISNGCHFIGMKFQNLDSNMLLYHKLFKEGDGSSKRPGGYSFLLKQEILLNPLGDNKEFTPLEGTVFETGNTLDTVNEILDS